MDNTDQKFENYEEGSWKDWDIDSEDLTQDQRTILELRKRQFDLESQVLALQGANEDLLIANQKLKLENSNYLSLIKSIRNDMKVMRFKGVLFDNFDRWWQILFPKSQRKI